MTDARTPGEKLGITRDMHIHAKLISGGGKRASLILARRDFGTERISWWPSPMH
jgi:hypothetical protein